MATLKTKLTLDMRGFRNGLKRASRGLKNFSRNIGRPLVTGIKNVAALTAKVVALGGALAGLAINKIATLGDQLGKMAKRTGISAQELARFRHAAELSGTSIEDMEKATRRMQASIHEAGRGTKTYTDALRAIGLEYKDLEGQNTAEQFDKVLKALGDTEDQTTKTAVAMQVFGRSGTRLLPMLADGAAGLEAMKKEADRLGLVLTDDQVKQAEMYKDQVSRLKGAFTGLANAVVPLGAINRAMQALIDQVVKLRQSQAFKEWAASAVTMAGRVISVTLRLGKAIFNFVQASSSNLKKFALIAAGVFLAFKTGLAVPLIKALALLGKGILTALVSPFGAALAAIVAIFAAFKLGKVLEQTFDLSQYIAEAMLGLQMLGQKIGAFFSSIGPNFSAEFEKAIADIDRSVREQAQILQGMEGGNGKSFSENLKAEWDQTVKDAKAAGKKLTDALLPDSVKGLLGDLGDLGKPITLPKLDLTMPEGIGAGVEDGVERGVVRGLTNRRWGRIFTGERARIGGSERDRMLYERNAKKQLEVSQSHTRYLRKLADNSVVAWSFA